MYISNPKISIISHASLISCQSFQSAKHTVIVGKKAILEDKWRRTTCKLSNRRSGGPGMSPGKIFAVRPIRLI